MTKLYSKAEIDGNKLYGSVMQEINDLYIKHGCPDQQPEGADSTTTGTEQDKFWTAYSIGDWEGREDEIADYANKMLEEVHDGIGLISGGIYYRNRTGEWEDFCGKAEELIEEYHCTYAFDTLCSIY